MEELKALTSSLIAQMSANTAEVAGMRVEQRQVLAEHRALRRANRRERVWRRFAVLFVVAAIAAVLVTNHLRGRHEKKLSDEQAADLQCISAYENANRARTIALTELTGPRSKALAAAIASLGKLTTAAASGNVTVAQGRALLEDFNRKQDAFLKADAAYTKALVDNPVPPPVFNCSDRLKTGKTQAAPAGVTPTPAVPATATATRLSSVTVAAPTVVQTVQTVTERQPARVMVTTTRTVTKTVGPRPCIPTLKPPCVIGLPK